MSDGGDQQRENHGEAGAAPHLQDELTGNSESTLNAPAPEESITPRKLNALDQMTATCGGRLWV